MTPPGWYPDPQNPSILRWWDGFQWTAQTRAARMVVPEPVPPSASSAAAVQPVAITPAPNDPAALESAIARLRAEYGEWSRRVVEVSEIALLQEVGIYAYRHRLDDAASYKERLVELKARIREAAKGDGAVVGAKRWAINGSAEEGQRMVRDLGKLMLRAYNNEADYAVQTMKPYGLDASIQKLEKSRETISRLGVRMQIAITDGYHRLRVDELELTADYLVKWSEEKEQERAERERMKDEEQAQRELQREQDRLEKERTHYETALAVMRANGDETGVAKAEAKIVEIQASMDGVKRRAANTRAGYVYVISNIGAFGDGVVKIGLTRRLEPRDRVRELGDASVPFLFDIHAILFSDDAVGLEGKLHDLFEARRVNMVNVRREFFFVTPLEVKNALMGLEANVLSYTEIPEALEWRQSLVARGEPPPPLPGATAETGEE